MGRFGKMWRDASRSLGFEVRQKTRSADESTPEEPVQPVQDEPTVEEPRYETATAAWIHTVGMPVFVTVRFDAESENVLLMPKSPPLDTPLWIISESRGGEPYFIQSSERTDDGFRVTAYRNENRRSESEQTTALGQADLLWVDSDGAVVSARVAIENGEPGEVVVTAAEAVAVPSVALLAGYEYRGLGSLKQCDAEDENFKLILEIADEVFLTSNAA